MRPCFRLLLLPVLLFVARPLSAMNTLSIDASKPGAPINPHVYGQFIEHLGRCIYGGIWAEMLEDRKFFYPVLPDYKPYGQLADTAYPVIAASPWEIVGSEQAVSMVTQQVFVGEHAPRMAAGSGVRQKDLGLVKGKAYVGYAWVRADSPGSAKLEVSLSWGEGSNEKQSLLLPLASGSGYSKLSFQFTAGEDTQTAMLTLFAKDADLVLGPVSLMPADNVRGMRADTLALLKQLGGTIYRWPGGNFTSGYEWRDGIGDRDRRPPRQNPAWTGVEHNDFGTDEFIDFCREIGTEPLIAANAGFGDPHSASEWVRYCNAAPTEPGGQQRAANGHEAPYGVRYWCVGNEMFGPWQLGFMQLSHYVIKHNLMADAMRKADPSLKLIAVGDVDKINTDYDPEQAKSGYVWSKGMLLNCADRMDYLSEHFYEGRLPWNKEGRPPLADHVTRLRNTIRHKAEAHRKLQASLPNLKGRLVPISMDEWNYWHREYVYGELGCRYDLADALGVAEGLHEFYRQTDLIPMAFYAQTVNVIGAIKTSKTAAEMETTGLVLQLYRHHFGQLPLVVEGCPVQLDASAALTGTGDALTVAVVNPTSAPEQLLLKCAPTLTLAGKGTQWLILGSDENAANAPGQARKVDISHRDLPGSSPVLELPPLSVSLFVLPLSTH
jgi:alpha-N-arabinofuranosidase